MAVQSCKSSLLSEICKKKNSSPTLVKNETCLQAVTQALVSDNENTDHQLRTHTHGIYIIKTFTFLTTSHLVRKCRTGHVLCREL